MNRLPAAALVVVLLSLGACDRDSGHAQKTTGKIESAVGDVTGDKSLQREGRKDEVAGGVKSAVGDLKDAATDAKH